MKLKILYLAFFLTTIVHAQEKIKISVFPFQNKSDKTYDWFSYGLSHLINESITSTGVFDGVSQELVHQATSDPDIHFLSALEGNPHPSLQKYQSSWSAHVFVVGNFSVSADSLFIYARVCDLSKGQCGSPMTVKGGYQDYKAFYFLVSRLMESLFTELKKYAPPQNEDALNLGRDKTRQICSDYDGYKSYIKSWMALRQYEDGMTAVSAGKLDEAIRFFENAQTFDEGNLLSIPAGLSNAYVLRGNEFYKKSMMEAASKDFSTAIVLNPANSGAYYNLGNISKSKNDLDNAVINYQKSLDLDPVNFDACINIGYVYLTQGKFSDAVASYEKAITIHEDAVAHYYAGVAYDNKGDAVNAIAHYRRAIEIDNAQAGAHLNLGILLKQQKDHAGARKEYEAAITLDPLNPTAHRNLGILLMNDKKEYAAAAEHLQKCLDLDPGQEDAAILKKNVRILKKKAKKK